MHPSGIIGGFPVETCAWPSAVFLTDSTGTCSGVYIGGHIVLTAAHCLSDRYSLDFDCQVDGDCPTVDKFGNKLALTCQPGDASICYNTGTSVVPSKSPTVLFGERYPNLAAQHPHKTIPVEYCRQRGFGDKPAFDFGYCVLSEEPAIQAVPVMMHCEADQFLTKGTPLVAVAFGSEDDTDSPPFGTKHFLLNTLKFDGSAAGGFSLSGWVGLSPETGVAAGDSGSPLFAKLPDGTWRVIGLASTNLPSYEVVWGNIAWMLEDPHVAAEQDKILPCHTPDGQWEPKVGCGQFPVSPDLPAGDWTRGPFVCNTTNVSGPSMTCGPAFSPPDAPPAPDPKPDSLRNVILVGSLLVGGLGAGAWGWRRWRGPHA